MSACRTDIDWSTRPSPWREIAARVREDCANIMKGSLPTAQPFKATARERQERRDALRYQRLALGLTQEEVAKVAGYEVKAVWRMEHGEGSAIARRTIAEALRRLEAVRK